ncbi:MAG: pyruvate kinase alpha/beta domain-containing protein [Candidatus Thermoplasmatota archaeon]
MFDTSEMNTDQVLEIAKDYAEENNIEDIVVATTSGETGVKTSEVFKEGFNVVAVTHSTGFKEKNKQELEEENKAKMEEKAIEVFTGSMIFHSWNDYYRKKKNTIATTTTMIADTLRMFGQGMKVCVECVAMAADAGLISLKPVLAIAGTVHGADTVVLIDAENSRRLMGMKILDVIAKPKK